MAIKYKWLKEILTEWIQKSIAQGNDRLPSEMELCAKISGLMTGALTHLEALEGCVAQVDRIKDVLELARFYHDSVLYEMKELRHAVDELEMNTDRSFWPMPSYGDILFSVN